MQLGETLLDVKNLKMYFPITEGILRKKVGEVKAVDDISFTVRKGETVGLVGESGCGKTTAGRSILQLYKPTAGEVIFEGEDLVKMKGKRLRAMTVRRREAPVILRRSAGRTDTRP